MNRETMMQALARVHCSNWFTCLCSFTRAPTSGFDSRLCVYRSHYRGHVNQKGYKYQLSNIVLPMV